MHTAQEVPPEVPLYVSYPPDPIIILAHQTPRVTLNIRPNFWPLTVMNAYHADPRWKTRAERHHGHLMYPEFTEFLKHRNRETKALICCQDAHGGIATLVDAISDVYWVGGPDDCGEKGAHAYIRLEQERKFGAPHGSLWGNYVLAISDVHPATPSTSKRDPHGTHFVDMFLRDVHPMN